MTNPDNSMMDEVMDEVTVTNMTLPTLTQDMPTYYHRRIMVVEPEPSICEFIQMSLQDEGYSVSLAFDAATANMLIDTFNPQVLIADMRILKAGAHPFVEHFKGFPVNERCVIALSTLPADETQAKAIGADMFIAKPFDLDELFQQIRKCLFSSFGPNSAE
jgi:DNA-binding response OmpR family regulator